MNEPTGTAGERNWKRISVLLAGLLALALIAAVALAVSRAESQGRVDAQRTAVRAAERIVVNWLTYDFRTYRNDMAWVTESGTPRFRKEFSGETRERIVEKGQLVSRGYVVNSAATVSDSNHAKVLLFTDQQLTDKDIRGEGAEPLHARSGVELTMVRVDGEWLVDALVPLQSQ